MDYKALMYLVYLTISVGLTVWVATTLSRNGQVFLEDVFDDPRLAGAVNRLLTMGFYLLNLGYASVMMRTSRTVGDTSELLEILSGKIGLVLLALGLLHIGNVLVLSRYRRSRLRHAESAPPLPPTTRLPMPPQPPMPQPSQMPLQGRASRLPQQAPYPQTPPQTFAAPPPPHTPHAQMPPQTPAAYTPQAQMPTVPQPPMPVSPAPPHTAPPAPPHTPTSAPPHTPTSAPPHTPASATSPKRMPPPAPA